MAANIGVVSTQLIDELFTSIEAGWNTIDFSMEYKIAKALTWFNDNASGSFVSYPISNGSSSPVEVPVGMNSQFGQPEVFKQVVTHKRWQPKQGLEVFDSALAMDLNKILEYQANGQDILKGARNLWDNLLAQQMIANPVGFDTVAHYSTSHPVNPARPGLGTYSNSAGTFDLDEAGLAEVMRLMMIAPDLDGEIDAQRVRKLAIVVPTPALWAKAVKLVGIPMALIPTPGTAANTSVAATTSFAGSDFGFEIILFNQLAASSQKRWYLFNVSDSMKRGFVTSIVQQPLLGITGRSPNDHDRVVHGSMKAIYTALGAVGNGRPRETVTAIAP